MRAALLFVWRIGLVAITVLGLPAPVAGQTGLATVTGLVSDPSGAPAPGLS